ncbi:hypothetical protein JCM8795_10790 [Hydrogenobaculum acidophilum]
MPNLNKDVLNRLDILAKYLASSIEDKIKKLESNKKTMSQLMLS